ncbi:MAG: PHP domain-containing protein [Ruminococcaceae bacterium]|nr:PHP domain-containing protein [Oscillospiraceae bacterium]
MFANYHTHTTRCHHAAGTEREYIESAIRDGCRILGFTDHSPQLFQDGFVSPIRMSVKEAERYVATLRDLAEEYKNDITIYVGFEAEYFPAIFPALRQYARDLGIDYMILGQHTLTEERQNLWTARGDIDPSLLPLYVDQVLEGLATGAFTYLAHPDVFHFRGEEAMYRREMRRLLEGVKALGLPIEYNLLGLREKRHYPVPIFWDMAAESGCEVILGRDAHAPVMLEEKEVEECARKELAARGITPLTTIPFRKP